MLEAEKEIRQRVEEDIGNPEWQGQKMEEINQQKLPGKARPRHQLNAIAAIAKPARSREEACTGSRTRDVMVSTLKHGSGGIGGVAEPDADSTYGHEGYPFF